MNSNQNPDENNNQGGGRRGAKIGTGAVYAGIFVSALVFGVYSITGVGDDDRAQTPQPADAPDRADAPTDAPTEEPPTDGVSAGDDRIVDETADDAADPSVQADPNDVAVGLSSLCITVVHDETNSGIWVRGGVSGLEEGWIWVEAPTVNGGEPVQVPVEAGVFDAPLPIVQYGDHEVTRFELVPGGPDPMPVDLMPVLLDGPGAVFPVDADEGPVFDSECFDFEVAAPAPNDDPVADPGADPTEAARVERFLDGFVEDHVAGDAAHLLTTLHPAIPLSFGDDVCTRYVERTTGSIAGATVVEVGQIGPLEMNTPAGPIGFPESIPFTVEFTLTDGSSMTNEAHLPLHDGTVHWLTTCGVDTP